MPSFLCILETEGYRTYSLFEKRMFFDEVDDIEACTCCVAVAKGEVEPVVVSAGIGIILKYEVVVLILMFEGEVG